MGWKIDNTDIDASSQNDGAHTKSHIKSHTIPCCFSNWDVQVFYDIEHISMYFRYSTMNTYMYHARYTYRPQHQAYKKPISLYKFHLENEYIDLKLCTRCLSNVFWNLCTNFSKAFYDKADSINRVFSLQIFHSILNPQLKAHTKDRHNAQIHIFNVQNVWCDTLESTEQHSS